MENQGTSVDGSSEYSIVDLGLEEDGEDFRSCCGDEEVLKETDDLTKLAEETKEELNEFSVMMFFKGISIAGTDDSCSGFSGIGILMQRSSDFPVTQVQKRLDFYVDESVADYLALIDGLVAAAQNNIRCIYAFTDSKMLHDQIVHEENLDIPIMFALRQRVVEHTSKFETFVLKLVPGRDLEEPRHLAQVSVGVVSCHVNSDTSFENCSICCEDRPCPMMITMKCAHKFCSHCMKTYVDGKVQSLQVPVRCPIPRCEYSLSATECKSFLPVSSFESLEKALEDANALRSDKIYCPYPNCPALLDVREGLSSGRASLSFGTGSSCMECPACERFVCVECGVPWHPSMSCEEFQNLTGEGIEVSDVTRNQRWRRCQQCRRMIELSQGCYHTTCWNGHQTCECGFWDDEGRISGSEDSINGHSIQESERLAWEAFNSLPMIMDGYSYSDQERSLIERFLALDHPPYQSPPRCTESYLDAAMKDLHQLPWLERLVSVISDGYYEEYFH